MVFNTKVVKVFRTPVDGQKYTFDNEFCLEICVAGKVVKKKTQMQQEIRESDVRFHNGGQ